MMDIDPPAILIAPVGTKFIYNKGDDKYHIVLFKAANWYGFCGAILTSADLTGMTACEGEVCPGCLSAVNDSKSQ